MKQSHAVRLSLAALLAAISLGAVAADQGFYTYASAGWTQSDRKAETDRAIAGAGASVFTSTADDEDTGYKVVGGYRVSTHLSVEAGYVNLGKYKYQGVATVPVATRGGYVKADGWTLGVVGSLPVTEKIAIFGKLGLVNYDLKYHCGGTGFVCHRENSSKNDTTLFYGAGADWSFTKDWFARAEYEVYEDIGSSFNYNGTKGTSKADVHLGSVGLGYRF